MRAISFSLFGSDPKYCTGAIRNADLVHFIYPGWTAVFYVNESVPADVQQALRSKGAELRSAPLEIPNGMFWRFLINDDIEVERYIVRDADSRLNLREKLAVDAWIESGRRFHVMRDHPRHISPIQGGMWGAMRNAIRDIFGLIVSSQVHNDVYERSIAFGKDQLFLERHIWPVAQTDCLQHDSQSSQRFPGSIDFPNGSKLSSSNFVGKIFPADA